MLILILFICLVTNISVIKCADIYAEINVEITESRNCTVDKEFKLPSGTGVVIRVTNKKLENIKTASVEKELLVANETKKYKFDVINNKTLAPYLIPNNKSDEKYTLSFKFIGEVSQGQNQNNQNNRNNHNNQNNQNNHNNQKHNLCRTRIFNEPSPDQVPLLPAKLPEWQTYLAIGGVAAGIIVIALLATTMYYKRQANMLSKHVSLERRTERSDENDRYCSNPRKAKKVSPILNNNRDSDIYEDPQIALGVPSRPPAIPTTPRPNRNYNTNLKKPASPSLTLKSNASHMSLNRPRAPDKDTQVKLSMANRPPLPLPQDEFYPEDPDDTYEEPPVPEKPSLSTLPRKPGQPERIGTIPKKLAKPLPENIAKPRPEKMVKNFEEKFGNTLPNIPMGGLRPPGVNPLQKPTVPAGKPTPPRNNVVQVPIRQIPDASSLKKVPLVKPKPNVKPKTPPPVEPVQFFNDDRRDSTDDEYWTYEPLPKYNIYNN